MPSSSTDRRPTIGRRGELIALWHLRLRGHRLLGRRVRTPHAEVDLVFRRGRALVVVEVKRRLAATEDGRWIRHRQVERLRFAARHLAREATWCDEVRLVLVTVEGVRVRSVTRL